VESKGVEKRGDGRGEWMEEGKGKGNEGELDGTGG